MDSMNNYERMIQLTNHDLNNNRKDFKEVSEEIRMLKALTRKAYGYGNGLPSMIENHEARSRLQRMLDWYKADAELLQQQFTYHRDQLRQLHEMKDVRDKMRYSAAE